MEVNPVSIPLPFDDKISLLSGGGGHVLIYTEDNRIFASGWNNKGQLGLGDIKDRSTFEEIPIALELDERVHQLSCGWDTSAILTTKNRLFVFGGNSFNQLGLDETKENVLRPRQITLLDDETPLEVHLSMRQIVIRSINGIYVSGRTQAVKDLHQKATSNSHFHHLQPDPPCQHISAGQHHLIYTTGQNKVIGIGQNKFNQSENLSFPGEILAIRSGWTHNGCLLASGDVYLWGRNTYGQLASGKTTTSEHDAVELNVPEKVQELHLGSEHGLVQSHTGNVYTWGWNEHGNCGNGGEKNVLVPERIGLNGRRAVKSCCGAGFCMVVTELRTEAV